jgi:hypothetical protein
MTANEIRYNILLSVDSLFEGTAPGYNDRQMSAIINKAQRRVFRDRVKLFDTDEKTKRMLSPLISRGSLLQGDISLTADTSITNYNHVTANLDSTFYTLPSDVARLVEEYASLEVIATSVILTPVLIYPITYDYFLTNYSNRYKKPYEELVWRLDTKLETSRYTVELIYPNTCTMNDVNISYIRYPIDIVVNVGTPGSQVSCEIIDVSFHDEIVGEAVKIITASLNDEGYQVSEVEKKFDEN